MARTLQKIRAFYAGWVYPTVILLLVFLGHCFEWELICVGPVAALFILGFCVCRDMKFALMPAMATFFMIPIGNYSTTSAGYNRYSETPVLIYLILLAASFAASIVFFVVRNRRLANRIPFKGMLLSLILLCGVSALNGAFTSGYTFRNLIPVLLLALPTVLVYCLFKAFLYFDRALQDYFVKCLVGVGLLICAELIFAYFTTVEIVNGEIVKGSVVLGWGIWTNIGNMLVLLMPACFYFAASHRFGWIGYGLGLLHYVCILLTQSRAALLIGGVTLLFCIGYVCIKGRNRRLNLLITAAVILCGVAGGVLIYDKVIALIQNFLNYGLGDNGRFDLWRSAWDAFLRNPIQGSGFYDTCSYPGFDMFGMPYFCHNTPLQFLGSCGAIGLLAYLYHRFETVKLFVRRPNKMKYFMGMCILGYLAFGMLDVVFFTGYPNIFYTLMLVFMEHSESGGNVPRRNLGGVRRRFQTVTSTSDFV